jgi:CcmD family protein
MVAFGAAYMIVWLAVVLYVARLTVHQRRLRDKVERLRAPSDKPASGCETTSRAA